MILKHSTRFLRRCNNNNSCVYNTTQCLYSTSRALHNKINLDKIALNGSIRPGTADITEFSVQLEHYLDNLGTQLQFYPQFINSIKDTLHYRKPKQQLTYHVAIPYNVAFKQQPQSDNTTSTITPDDIASNIKDYMSKSLDIYATDLLYISNIPPTIATDSIELQNLFIALDVLYSDSSSVIKQGYGLDSTRLGLSTKHQQYISLQQIYKLYKPKQLTYIKTPVNLSYQYILHNNEQLNTMKQHNIQLHSSSPFISKHPVTNDDISFYTYDSHDNAVNSLNISWPEYLKQAFDMCIVCEKLYVDIYNNHDDKDNLPSIRDISIAHSVANHQQLLYNSVRYEHILYNDILPKLDKYLDTLSDYDELKEWLKRYRFGSKTLLHRLAYAIQHTTYHQNQKIINYIDKLNNKLEPLKQLESKIICILQSVPHINYISTDNASYCDDIAQHDIRLTSDEALYIMNECNKNVANILPQSIDAQQLIQQLKQNQ